MNKDMNVFFDYLDELFPSPRVELNYEKDYQLVIAVVLSARSTDKTVNKVTEVLFSKYKNLEELAEANIEDILPIVKPCGSFNKKGGYVKAISEIILNDCNGVVPNDREKLESMPGVGRKSANIILNEIYDVPAIAVDTHVTRVSNRLEFIDSVKPLLIEERLMEIVPIKRWGRTHKQMVLFGRYHCTSRNPKCDICKLNGNFCKWKKS